MQLRSMAPNIGLASPVISVAASERASICTSSVTSVPPGCSANRNVVWKSLPSDLETIS